MNRIRVSRRAVSAAGSCNFCGERVLRTVYEFEGIGPNNSQMVRICGACLQALIHDAKREGFRLDR